ncbi:MAG TPA: hypothetical protein VFQ68_45020 [Streptosporangiaceae bacterium]|nr:hypothetical protein [Streptosporangiaceae bacterium]
MKLFRSRLAQLAGCAALVLGVAGTAGTVPAQARVTAAASPPHVVASWGGGSLGDPVITSRPLFGAIGAGSNVVQVDARYGHGLAARSDGTVWAWGDNTNGELGIGTTASITGPVQVTGLTGDTQAQASQALQAAGLMLGAVTRVTDNHQRPSGE